MILAAGVLGLTACSGRSEGLKMDSPAPSFKLNDLAGQSVSLSNFKGKSVFINFWGTTSILIGQDGAVKLNTIGAFKNEAAIEQHIANFLD